MSAHVVIVLVNGKVSWVTDGDVTVDVLDYDHDPETAKRHTAGLQRLMRDLERTGQ